MSETVDRLLRRARSIRLAVTPTAASPRVPRRQRHKLGLRGALTALVLSTVILTALLIHLFWSVAARRNVGDVVGQLNRQIVEFDLPRIAWRARRCLVNGGGGPIDLLSGHDKGDGRGQARVRLSGIAALATEPLVDFAGLSRRRIFRLPQSQRHRNRHDRGQMGRGDRNRPPTDRLLHAGSRRHHVQQPGVRAEHLQRGGAALVPPRGRGERAGLEPAIQFSGQPPASH